MVRKRCAGWISHLTKHSDQQFLNRRTNAVSFSLTVQLNCDKLNLTALHPGSKCHAAAPRCCCCQSQTGWWWQQWGNKTTGGWHLPKMKVVRLVGSRSSYFSHDTVGTGHPANTHGSRRLAPSITVTLPPDTEDSAGANDSSASTERDRKSFEIESKQRCGLWLIVR